MKASDMSVRRASSPTAISNARNPDENFTHGLIVDICGRALITMAGWWLSPTPLTNTNKI